MRLPLSDAVPPSSFLPDVLADSFFKLSERGNCSPSPSNPASSSQLSPAITDQLRLRVKDKARVRPLPVLVLRWRQFRPLSPQRKRYSVGKKTLMIRPQCLSVNCPVSLQARGCRYLMETSRSISEEDSVSKTKSWRGESLFRTARLSGGRKLSNPRTFDGQNGGSATRVTTGGDNWPTRCSQSLTSGYQIIGEND